MQQINTQLQESAALSALLQEPQITQICMRTYASLTSAYKRGAGAMHTLIFAC